METGWRRGTEGGKSHIVTSTGEALFPVKTRWHGGARFASVTLNSFFVFYDMVALAFTLNFVFVSYGVARFLALRCIYCLRHMVALAPLALHFRDQKLKTKTLAKTHWSLQIKDTFSSTSVKKGLIIMRSGLTCYTHMVIWDELSTMGSARSY